MPDVRLEHFKRAAVDIGAHGDNDTLPFDVDNRFVKENEDALAELAFTYSRRLLARKGSVPKEVGSLAIFSERLLAPTGTSGFRIATKIHPFWNLFFNGLGIAIAEALEPQRESRAHSYRFLIQGNGIFDRAASWRAFREACIEESLARADSGVVVQTDISSFYEHVSHHRLENSIADLFPQLRAMPVAVDRLLSRFASAAGRSFGLPVGGQCARILAEVLLSSIDRRLSDEGIVWRRYVDDIALFTASQADAYRALSILSHALADYGLTLNRTKTTMLAAKHFSDYVRTQLGGDGSEAKKLLEIDLHFDPYSDTREADYDDLKRLVDGLDIRALLDLELHKAQPDTFLVAQVGRTLRYHDPRVALELCATLLSQVNLHAFRASWATIMRGVAQVRAEQSFAVIFDGLDGLLDAIPRHSPHLLRAEASCLHYLRTIRFRRTQARAEFVLQVYSSAAPQALRRACIDCWREWKDRPSFIRERNRWESLGPEQQRMLWFAASEFDDEGEKFRQQVRNSLERYWSLGFEEPGKPTFASIYAEWAAR
jgi:Reverse transcriptase (RNA-dependent DNA polymerase)